MGMRLLDVNRIVNWDFTNKLKAVNTMKEIYDNLKPSATYTRDLDEKLVLNPIPSRHPSSALLKTIRSLPPTCFTKVREEKEGGNVFWP